MPINKSKRTTKSPEPLNGKFIPSVGIANMPIPPSWKAIDQLNSYESWVYTCINAIAQEVASVRLKLYKKKYIRGELEIDEVTEHEALSLLYSVNPYSNYYLHIYETVIYLYLLGEAYWAVLRNGQKPVSLWTLRPDYMTVVPSAEKLIAMYRYRVAANNVMELQPEDVIPFRLPNPKTPYRGQSPVQSAARAVDTDKFSADWNRNFFFNSAIPNLIMTTDKDLKEDAVNRLLAMWVAKFQGTANAHKVAFLTSGFKPTVIGQTGREMDFIEQRKAMRDEILAMFKVPKTVLGLSEDVNRANAEATNLAFLGRTVTPAIKMLIAHLNEFYLREWADEDLFFDFDDPSPEDTDLKMKIYESGLKNGWLTINEVRERENLDPVQGGDVVYLSNLLTPIDNVGKAPTQTNQPVQEPNKGILGLFKKDKQTTTELPVTKSNKNRRKFNVPIPPIGLNKLREERLNMEIKTDLIKLVSLSMNLKADEVTPSDKKKEIKDAYWYKMISQTDVWEQKMKEMLYTDFAKQEKEVLHNISEAKGINLYGRKAQVDSLLFDESAFDVQMKKEFAKLVQSMLEERAIEVFNFMGLSNGRLNIHTSTATHFLNTDGLAFVQGINDTTRENLRDQLVNGLREGESIAQLKERVNGVFIDAKGQRAEKIARTEVLRSTNFATVEAYRQSNVVEAKEWLTALDPCPICAPLDGQTVPLNGKFLTPDGAIDFPPEHPNCRCTTIPVMKEKAITIDVTKSVKKDKLNAAIIEKAAELEGLITLIEESKLQIDEMNKEAKDIKDKAEKEAHDQKTAILEDAKKEGEEEKKELLKELKELRDEVKKAVDNG